MSTTTTTTVVDDDLRGQFPFTCAHCGKTAEANWGSTTLEDMVMYKGCFDCSYWLSHADQDAIVGDYLLTSDYIHYIAGDENAPAGSRGFSGRRWEITKTDGTKIVSTNLWHQGEVPVHLRKRFVVNVREMKG